jgi:hypothetical protein
VLRSTPRVLALGILPKARQHYAEYEKQFTRFAEGVNVEVNVINTILYAHVTPFWRALYKQLRHKPVPFEPAPSPRADGADRDPIRCVMWLLATPSAASSNARSDGGDRTTVGAASGCRGA